MEKIKVLIADDIEDTRKVIKMYLSLDEDSFEVVGEASDGEEVLKLIPRVRPHIVLMDINMPKMNGLEASEKISELYPSTIVIIVSVQGESEYLKKAMFSGAKEYIIKPFSHDSLVSTIKATYEKNKERFNSQINQKSMDKNAQIISFYSTKGGVGKTILSLNSALVFSNELKRKTLIIDLDLLFGDISVLVNRQNEKTLLDIIDDNQTESYADIMPYLCSYNENLDMLFAPRNPEASEYISKDSIKKLMDTFKKYYDVIIIDTGINFNDVTLYVLDISETIMFVSNMEISSLKNTKLGLNVMNTLNYDNTKLKLIINQASNGFGVTEKDLQELFKNGIYAVVPEDIKAVRTSINKGTPLIEDKKMNTKKVCKVIREMCFNLLKS